jgi:hypothetical protein
MPEPTELDAVQEVLRNMQPPWVKNMEGQGPFSPDALSTGPVPPRAVKASMHIPPKASIGNMGLGGDAGSGGGNTTVAAAVQTGPGTFEVQLLIISATPAT